MIEIGKSVCYEPLIDNFPYPLVDGVGEVVGYRDGRYVIDTGHGGEIEREPEEVWENTV